MKVLKILGLCGVAAVFLGCSTTHDLSSGNRKRSELARIQVTSQYGSGRGAQHVQVVRVDGKDVDPNAEYVTVEPGYHVVAFDFQEVTDAGGSFSFTLNLFGNETTAGPRPGSAISSMQPIEASGNLQAGATYYVDTSSMSFSPVPLTQFEQQMKNTLGDRYPQKYRLSGSPQIRKK